MIRMAKFSLGVVAALMICFGGSAVAQNGLISVDSVDGMVGAGQVQAGADITFWLRFTNNTGDKRQISNGFKVYSEDGAVWDTTIGDSLTYDGSVLLSRAEFSFGYIISHFSTDGASPDTIGFFAQGNAFGSDELMPDGFDDVPYSIKVVFDGADQSGHNICIDSVSFFPSAGTWKWDNGLGAFVEPGWNGPFCYDIVNPGAVSELDDLPLPTDYALEQNYPNPFNPTTTIQFALPERAHVTLDVFNVLGQRVRTLVNEELAAGTYNPEFDGTSDGGTPLASGLYFYRLQTSTDYVETRKMVLVK